MFNLENAVEEWSESVGRSCFRQQEQVDELQDHLYSEIDSLQAQGLDAEQAFLKATERIGDAESLRSEFAKNGGVLTALFSAEHKLQETINKQGFSARAVGIFRIAHALFFAFAMLASSWIMSQSGDETGTVLMLLVAVWFGTSLLIPNQSLQCEVDYFKRRFREIRGA